MRNVSIRYLKANLQDPLHEVHEGGQILVVTLSGRPIARIIPEPPDPAGCPDFESLWSELDRLAEEISREWPEGVSAAQAISEDRREI